MVNVWLLKQLQQCKLHTLCNLGGMLLLYSYNVYNRLVYSVRTICMVILTTHCCLSCCCCLRWMNELSLNNTTDFRKYLFNCSAFASQLLHLQHFMRTIRRCTGSDVWYLWRNWSGVSGRGLEGCCVSTLWQVTRRKNVITQQCTNQSVTLQHLHYRHCSELLLLVTYTLQHIPNTK